MSKEEYIKFCENNGILDTKEEIEKIIFKNDDLSESDKKSLNEAVDDAIEKWVMDNHADGLIDQAELLMDTQR